MVTLPTLIKFLPITPNILTTKYIYYTKRNTIIAYYLGYRI